MVARWMQPKIIKIRRERRAWARPFTIKGSSPNYANGKQYKETSLDLSEETIVTNERATRKMPVPELRDLTEVRRELNDPLFVQPLDNPIQRLRIYYNSRHTCFILQWVEWRHQRVSISITYPTFTIAYQHWIEDRTRWKHIHKFQ